MILELGSIVLVSHRRMFDNDESRYFIGRTVASEGELVKLEGFSFVRDLSTGIVIKKEEKRRKIVALSSPSLIVYQLPETQLETLEFESGNGDVILKNGESVIMNMSERTHCGQF